MIFEKGATIKEVNSGLIAVVVTEPGGVHPEYGEIDNNTVVIQCPFPDGKEGAHIPVLVIRLDSYTKVS